MKDAEVLIASYTDDQKIECLIGLLAEGGSTTLASALTNTIDSVNYQSKSYASLVNLVTGKRCNESILNTVMKGNSEISTVICNLNSAESF